MAKLRYLTGMPAYISFRIQYLDAFEVALQSKSSKLIGSLIMCPRPFQMHTPVLLWYQPRAHSMCDEHLCCAGCGPSEAWEAVRDMLMPAVKACLLPGSQTGWRDAGDACLEAEPICEALSLYHLLLSRDAQQGQSLTGMSQQP